MKTTLVAMTMALAIVFLGTGCASIFYPGGMTPPGVFVTHLRAPAQNLSVATDATAHSTRAGSSSCGAIMGLFAFGDASVDTAMRNGGITKVHHVDYSVSSVCMRFWVGMRTHVYGE